MQQTVQEGQRDSLAQAVMPQFRNAIPVVVTIVPVIGIDPEDGQEKTGVVAIRRDIPPKIGELALTGGYLEYEDWSAAGLRELFQETGIDLRDSQHLKLISVQSVEEGRRLLIFGMTETLRESDLPPFVPNEECSERVILYRPIQLAFPAHTQALADFFRRSESIPG